MLQVRPEKEKKHNSNNNKGLTSRQVHPSLPFSPQEAALPPTGGQQVAFPLFPSLRPGVSVFQGTQAKAVDS